MPILTKVTLIMTLNLEIKTLKSFWEAVKALIGRLDLESGNSPSDCFSTPTPVEIDEFTEYTGVKCEAY